MGISIAPSTAEDMEPWIDMRHALWPEGSRAEHREEAESLLRNPRQDSICLIARDTHGACGFAEIALRHDYVNGCDTSPVAFLEGIYVAPEARQQGVARALVAAAEAWAAEQGCTEFASDAAIDNLESAAMHRALGFEETERVVYFRKVLAEA
ncbi:MAG TPA: aminoglycoside 6'-N-acetyltransferase [Devosiaceae bacterium]|jgi:aminoglycoside 6'-N-acetyltransferase I|nr:aminoglycoside 6'-N-acetyltransferase [Devosiaceae bacterium]